MLDFLPYIRSLLLVLLLSTLSSAGLEAQIFVDQNATGLNNGSSWANAFTDLNDALAISNTSNAVWVAEGIYYPSKINNRSDHFLLKPGVKIYGGFAGNESLRSQRNWDLHPTILSADIGVPGDTSDNSRIIFFSELADSSSHINGFIFESTPRDGYAARFRWANPKILNCTFRNNAGQALLCEYKNFSNQVAAAIHNCEFINNELGAVLYEQPSDIMNCHFEGNWGAALSMRLSQSTPQDKPIRNCSFIGNGSHSYSAVGVLNMFTSRFENCVFQNNSNLGDGGAVRISRGSASFFSCSFLNNSSGWGGAIYLDYDADSLTISNSVFYNNSSATFGGAIYHGANSGNSRIQNSLFLSNSSNRGGALYCSINYGGEYISNCTFFNNQAFTGKSIQSFKNTFDTIYISNSILWGSDTNQLTISAFTGNRVLIRNSICPDKYGYTGIDVVHTSPLFRDTIGLDGIVGTLDDDLDLSKFSPARNFGNDSIGNSLLIPFDIEGRRRINEDTIDMGAFEYYDCGLSNFQKAQILTPDTLLCISDSVTLFAQPVASGFGYWTSPDDNSIDQFIHPELRLSNLDTGISKYLWTVEWCDTVTYDTVLVKRISKSLSDNIALIGESTFCIGDSVMLIAPGNYTSLVWSNGQVGDTIIVKNSAQISFSAVDVNSCATISSNLQDIISNPLPPVPNLISSHSGIVCDGNIVSIQTQPARPLIWSTGDTASTVSFNAGIATIYAVGLDTNSGCISDTSNTVSFSLVPNPAAPVILSPEGQSACDYDSILLAIDSTGHSPFWSNGMTTQSIWVKNAGLITAFQRDSNGCQSLSDSIVLTFLPRPASPIISAFPSNEFCEGERVALLSNYQGSDPLVWSTGDTINSVLIDTVQTVNCVRIDTFGCKSLVSNNIPTVMNPIPDSDQIFGQLDVCLDSALQWYSVNGDLSSDFFWQAGPHIQFVSALNKDSIRMNFFSSGLSWISVYEVNQFGCIGDTITDSIRIREFYRPELKSMPRKICFDDSIILDFEVEYKNPNSTYIWNYIGGVYSSGQGSEKLSLKVTGPDSLIVSVEEINNSQDSCFGISDTVSIFLYPNPRKDLDIAGLDEICYNDSCYVASYPGWPNSSFQWFSDVAFCFPPNANISNLNPMSSGSFSVSVLERSEFGCFGDTVNKSVTVHPKPDPQPLYVDSVICSTRSENSRYIISGFDSSSFEWMLTGGEIVTGHNSPEVRINWNELNNLNLSVLEVSDELCYSDTLKVGLYSDSSDVGIISVGYNENFTKFLIRSSLYSWMNNPTEELELEISGNINEIHQYQLNSLPNSPEIELPFAEDYGNSSNSFEMSFANSCGDSLITSKHINVFLAGASNEKLNSVDLKWNEYVGWGSDVLYEVYRYSDLGADLVYSTYDTIAFLETSRKSFSNCYFVRSVNEENSDVSSFSNLSCYEFERNLLFPNSITVNGDGKNDRFEVLNLWRYPDNRMIIYNRNGGEVFRQQGYEFEWPGESIQAGTYYYDLQIFSPFQESYKGFIHVLR